jgi:hypothetical protein
MIRLRQFPILAFLAAALFLRALVPAGWMPAPEHGVFAIAPCPAADDGLASQGSSHHHGPQKAQHDGDCAFAPLLAGFAMTDAAPALIATAATAELPLSHREIAAFPTGPPAPPPPATGPPAIA